jgi:GntR family transcriptional regulator, rspAB operon transcriptional repressor
MGEAMATSRAEGERGNTAQRVVAADRPDLTQLLVEPIERTGLTQTVYELLRAKIMARELLPGQRIDVAMLARVLGVSRTPVKEAINRLAAEGAIDILPQHGTFIASIDWPALAELHDIRMMIETYVCEALVYPVPDDRLAELNRLIEAMERLTDGDAFADFPAHLELDRVFHTVIVGLAGNDRLTRLYEQVNLPIRLARAYPDTGELRGALATRTEHVAIVAALTAADAARARDATRDHLQNAVERHLSRLDVEPTGDWLVRGGLDAESRHAGSPGSGKSIAVGHDAIDRSGKEV